MFEILLCLKNFNVSQSLFSPVVRPEPPPEFDENAAVVSIEERLKKCRRRPGEY